MLASPLLFLPFKGTVMSDGFLAHTVSSGMERKNLNKKFNLAHYLPIHGKVCLI